MAYTDTFTGTGGTELHAYNAAWVSVLGTMRLNPAGNNATADSGEHSCYRYNQTFNSKHYAKAADIYGVGGPAIRCQSGAVSYFYHYGYGGKCFAGQVIAESFTDWDSGQGTFSDGDVLELWVDATTETTIISKKNGATLQTYTGKNLISGGQPGIMEFSDGVYVDDFEGGDVGGGQAPVLHRLTLLGVGGFMILEKIRARKNEIAFNKVGKSGLHLLKSIIKHWCGTVNRKQL
jgi:hypothetical protein